MLRDIGMRQKAFSRARVSQDTHAVLEKILKLLFDIFYTEISHDRTDIQFQELKVEKQWWCYKYYFLITFEYTIVYAISL